MEEGAKRQSWREGLSQEAPWGKRRSLREEPRESPGGFWAGRVAMTRLIFRKVTPAAEGCRNKWERKDFSLIQVINEENQGNGYRNGVSGKILRKEVDPVIVGKAYTWRFRKKIKDNFQDSCLITPSCRSSIQVEIIKVSLKAET